jgi:hypothetical protein
MSIASPCLLSKIVAQHDQQPQSTDLSLGRPVIQDQHLVHMGGCNLEESSNDSNFCRPGTTADADQQIEPRLFRRKTCEK